MVDVQHQSPDNSTYPIIMRRADAARYLREAHGVPCAPTTLAKYAVLGGGPAFCKTGKFPIYLRDDLDAWAEKRRSKRVHTTSELVDHGP